ncbi:addiction module protein [Duganella sp. Dugasp56]|uniref:addiction module protein n=1 Tax=Duganella sp. Dugasp56 TaxID=3243046 RepID=UPI0039B069A1
MNANFKALAAEALKLAPDEREAFVQLLMASLNQDAGIDEAWAVEVERRIAEVESGAISVQPVATALAEVRKNIK